ncbi:hypothetical protein PHPALM_20100 [Phytophthora palmivora]|uniref:Uncharacterized protein n=1 Tax=Phytophthora palmivora TaxID=4796 RepID=A0A2P4XFQ5_9STRA|nr:hypothetical protein PHPALM_20100 [Phytophthora palmivora]
MLLSRLLLAWRNQLRLSADSETSSDDESSDEGMDMDYSSLYLVLESRRYVTRRKRVEHPPSRINYYLTRMPDDEFRLHFRMTRLYFHAVGRAIANSPELQSVDEPDEDTTGSTKDPTSAPDAPSQHTPVDDPESSETKAVLTSSPAQTLTLAESKARAQAAKAASQKRAEGAAAKKCAALGYPTQAPYIAKGYRSLFDSESDEAAEEGLLLSPKRSRTISTNRRSPIKLLNRKALQRYHPLRLPRRFILADTIHLMWGLGLPCSWSTSGPLVNLTLGALHVAPMSVPWFKTNHY